MFMGAESLDLPQHKRLLLSIYATTSSSESPIDITKGGVIMKEPGIYTRICLTTVNAFSGDNSENKEYSLDVLYKCCNEVKCSGPYSMKIHISPGPAVPIAHDVNFYIGSAKMNEINVKRDREDRHDPETKIILLFYSDMNRNFYLNSSKNSIIDTTRQHVTLDSQTFYYRSNISSIENLDTPIDSLDYVISRSNLCYSNVAKIRIFRIHDIPDISEAALEQLESAREFSTIFSLVDKRILEPHGQEAKAVIKTLPNGALYQCIRDSDGVFPFNLPKIVQIDEKELPCTVSTASSLIYRPFVSSLHNYNNTFSYDLVNPVGNLLPKKLNIHITSINQPPRIIYITERFISSSQTSEFKLFWNIAELENPIHEHNMTLKLLDACETDEWKLFRCLDNICENVDMSPIPKQDSYLLKPSYTVERNCSYSEHLSEIMTLYPCRYAAYRYLFYPDPKLNRNCFYRLMLRVSNPVFESRSVNITLNALSTNKPPFIWVPPLIEFSYPVKELYIKSYKDEDLSYDKYAYVDDTDARSDCKKKLTVKVVHGAVENFRIISDVKICESPTTSSSTLECYGTTDELNSLFKDLRVIMKTDTVDIKFLLSNEGCVSTSNTSIDNVYISSVMTRIIYTRSADSHIPQASYIIAASFTVVFFVFVVFVYKKLQRYFSTPYFDVEREINMALLMHHSHESNPNSSISVDIQLSETDSDGHDFSM
ncbi:uncharacterized protein LOC126320583 [Schistocerca gregaria]|uniref:uncharacterized protein LOC126320583 n=1 Tax=Schistocerca gregaria TaxID=7010 RepID=UPI00211E7B20|nr:uncharacterized protein LOC126320583 [Schistocerca gregaria]